MAKNHCLQASQLAVFLHIVRKGVVICKLCGVYVFLKFSIYYERGTKFQGFFPLIIIPCCGNLLKKIRHFSCIQFAVLLLTLNAKILSILSIPPNETSTMTYSVSCHFAITDIFHADNVFLLKKYQTQHIICY